MEKKMTAFELTELAEAQVKYAAESLKITPDEVVCRALNRSLGQMIKERGSDRDGDAAYYAERFGAKQ